MGTPTQIYVDPAINADSGTGSIGDPYGDLQYALNTATRDATNGDQFNVKAGTTENLSSALSFATYGTPAATAPCIIRGYTSAANDGGRGVVSGGGSVACINSGSVNHVKLVDMRFTNTGANAIITLGTNVLVLNCEVDTSTASGVLLGNNGKVIGSFIHNCGAVGVQVGTIGYIAFNTLRNETNDFSQAIQLNGSGVTAIFNIIDIDGSSNGVNVGSAIQFVAFNSVYSNGGTGVGIRNATTTHTDLVIINNTIEGFSGGGGIGLQVTSQNADAVGYNLLYNNATATSLTGDINAALGNNDTAGATPFTNAGSDDFDPIAGLLASYPSYPTTWNNYASTQQNLIRMAAQYAAGGASGGGPIFGGMIVR